MSVEKSQLQRPLNGIVKRATQRRDEWGLSWQITPAALMQAITDPDRAAARRAIDAMMRMKKIDIAVIEPARWG